MIIKCKRELRPLKGMQVRVLKDEKSIHLNNNLDETIARVLIGCFAILPIAEV